MMRTDDRNGFLGRLRAAALVAVGAGAVGSIGLMLRAGHPPLFLRVLFAIWVLSPFVVLIVADMVSTRWSVLTRATLYGVMLVLTVASLAIYGNRAVRPPSSQPAFVYVLVPPVSWLLIAVVVPMAALIAGRRSRHDDGA